MSTVLGYIAVAIVCVVFIYIMGNVMINQWKDDKKSFMISVALVLALIISIVGLILKGMGL